MNEARFRDAERRLWESFAVTPPPRPTERRVPLARAGGELRLQEAGDPDGAPVVFVHGTSNSGASWAPLVVHLHGFRCILLDRPGCGLSPPVAARFDNVELFETFAQGLVVDVLDALDIDRAHVIATSFGGFTAFHTAAAHPERVDRIVQLGWLVGAPTRKLPMIMRLSSVPALGKMMARMPVNRRIVRSMLRQIGLRQAVDDGLMSDVAIDCFLSLLHDTDTFRNELNAGPRIMTLRGLEESILLPDHVLGAVQAPTYFLWGEDDPLGGADVATAFASRVPDAKLEVVPGVGHAPWIDRPEHVAAAITEHFRAGGASAT